MQTNNGNILISVKEYFAEEAQSSHLKFLISVDIFGASSVLLYMSNLLEKYYIFLTIYNTYHITRKFYFKDLEINMLILWNIVISLVTQEFY